MTELARRESADLDTYISDPTGGRLVAWAAAAGAANQLAKALTTTTFVPAAFKGNAADATAAILMGDELGLSPLAALRSIYVVHGTPALYARSMVALAQSQGHQVWTEATSDQRVVVCGRRRGSENVERCEWTMARAQKAGYTTNKKYVSNPQEMLYSKAAGEVVRKIAADALVGVPYSVEDLELEEDQPATTVTRQPAVKRTMNRQKPMVEEPSFGEEPPLPAAAAEPPADEPPADGPAPITEPQMKLLQAHYGSADRAARLAEASGVVGRDLASFSELSKSEASNLIEWVNGPDPDEPGVS